MREMTGKLSICRASAGSGKTHKLTGEYLRMLFSGEKDRYRSILAVTFTNKATAEMKHRILKELKILSENPESSPFLDELRGVVRGDVKAHATSLLNAMLNDYSYFNISTIDKFFQKVLRAFAIETGHFSSYNVRLDDNAVMDMVVDGLMDSLENKPELLDWLIELSFESVKKGENWDTVPLLRKLGGELFREQYKLAVRSAGGRVLDRNEIESFGKKMQAMVEDCRDCYRQIGKEAMAIMERYGLDPSDFKGGSRSHAFVFRKVAEGQVFPMPASFLKAVGAGEDGWYSGTSRRRPDIVDAYNDGLGRLAEDLSSPDLLRKYSTATEILRNFSAMGIFSDIEEGIRNFCRRNNAVLLSQTTKFLSEVIDGSDTPFIYERIGGRLSNYLLDEFQDTSSMQWMNFEPLVRDSVDNGYSSLLVGDVKQSIYRWRSSDWELLEHKVQDSIDPAKVEVETLSYNWRSSREVVGFNNGFFSSIGKMLEDSLIEKIYSDVCQKLPSRAANIPGHVHITFMEGNKSTVYASEEYHSLLLERIGKLLANGYRKKDIAFLVRTNGEAEELASFLISSGYPIVTDESLKLRNSVSVNRIVNILKLETDPEDSYAKMILGDSHERIGRGMSLYDACEDLIRKNAGEDTTETAYLCSFLDAVESYISLYGSDLGGFLKWWDAEGADTSVSMPDGQDALRVLTIHKSKGLEFPAVIVPHLSFDFDSGGRDSARYIWCRTEESPFSEIPYYPLEVRKSLEDTVFRDDYLKEKRYSRIDTCNVAYVAFTRAVNELVMIAPFKPDKSGNVPLNGMGGLLYNYLKEGIRNGIYESGEWTVFCSSEDTGVISECDCTVMSLPSVEMGDRLRLALSGEDFFSGEKNRLRGIILHEILSRINVEEDIGPAVNSALEEGLLSVSESEDARERISAMVVSVRDRHWFDGTYQLMNETPILTPGGENYRPDRIMADGSRAIVIDYKFGEKEKSHFRQVSNYAELLEKMGFDNVSSFLWYEKEIVQVT